MICPYCNRHPLYTPASGGPLRCPYCHDTVKPAADQHRGTTITDLEKIVDNALGERG